MLKTLFCIILFFSLIGEFQLQAQESAYPLRTVKQSGRSWVYLRDIAAYYGMKPSVKGKVFTASAKDKKLKITQNLRKFYINDVVVDLSFACSKVNGQLVIAKEDFQLTIDPIFRSWALPKHRLKTIVIDPGHGGKDSGARGSKVYEKDVVLKAGRMLKTRLEKYGFNVIMTRNSDHYLTLTKRGDFKGDLFISLHCNSATAKSAKGFEIWYCTPKGMKAFGKHDVLSRSVAGNHMNPNNVNLA